MKNNKLRLLWIPALLLLALVLVIVNQQKKPVQKPIQNGEAATSFDPTQTGDVQTSQKPRRSGEILSDFTITCVDGSEFKLSDHRGKVVVINFWATWCTPCVKELPHFDELQKAHQGDVVVLALHSPPILTDIDAYLAAYDYGIAFAIDDENAIGMALNVSTVLPQTAVIDPDGVIVYNKIGAVTYEKLEELVADAKG